MNLLRRLRPVSRCISGGTLLLATLLAPALRAAPTTPLPHLEPRGHATQLIVDGQPYLILGGEVANTASSDLAYMDTVWPKLARLHLNTVLVAVAWAWVEPEEGRFDFHLVDQLLAGARANHLHLVFLWFGSWKNSVSSFAPAWVKADRARFPFAQIAGGKSVEILSTFTDATRAADTRAYVKFLQHLAQADPQHTALMIQLQNEVGILGDSRDRSPAADAAFAAPVPSELLAYLAKNKSTLSPALAKLWTAAGEKTSGTWTDIFGATPATDELFMAWHYARFMNAMAAAGKAVLPLPVFTNTWIVQPEDRAPGDYPSGGAQPLTLDLWKCAAPSIDLNCPDIYLPNFPDHVAAFHRAHNPIFIPESRGDAAGVANAFYAIGAHASLGYSPFGIDNPARLLALRPAAGAPEPTDLEDLPLAQAYAVLRDLAPLILDHQSRGTLAAAWLSTDHPRQQIQLNGCRLAVELRQNRRAARAAADAGYAMIFALGPDEFLVAGADVQMTFQPLTDSSATVDAPIAGIADAEAGVYRDGRWQPHRKLSGDDIMLDYHLASAAAQNQSGSGLRFGPGAPTLQRVKLYRYR